jgi:tetratricopeptide (TPR) repeat protein
MTLVLVPLVVLGGLELGLRLVGFGYPTHFFLPERLNGERMMHDNQLFGWRFFPPAVARTTRPVVFSQIKPPQTCRIFVFGESAAFGDPSPAFGLPRVLEVILRNRYPNLHFEIINVAMTAINSNVILPIARDCAQENGDVWVIYMGNNEVVGPYGGGTVFGPQVPSLGFIRASISLNATRIGQLLSSFRASLFDAKSRQSPNVSLELFLNYKLRRDDPRMAKVYAHFAQNLEDILQTGIKSGAKVFVSSVASNLKDCGPFASLHRTNLSAAEQSEWDRLYQAGIKSEQAGQLSEAEKAYAAAARIDDQWAELQFRQARVLWNSGDFNGSLSHYVLARDYDALRFRADSRFNDVLRQTCSNRFDQGVAFVNGNEVIAQHSPHGVPGEELLYEHVHLTFTGNYWLARALAEQITGTLKPAVLNGQVPAGGDWVSEEECSTQLGLNDWDRYQTLGILLQRLEGAPFTLQLNNAEQSGRIQKQINEYRNLLSGQRMQANIERCQHALSLNPKDWVLHQKLAQILEQFADKAQQARAIEEWRQVIALVPHYPEPHYELGVLLDQAGRPQESETQLRLALKLKSGIYPNALNVMGRVSAEQNRLAEAVVQYERALELKPNFPDALANLGEALNRLGRKEEAKARFEQAMQLAPGNSNVAVNLGQLLDEHGELSAALIRDTEAVRADPNNAVAHFDLAQCLRVMGRSSEAQREYAEALRLDPDYADAHSQLAMELAKSGKEKEAFGHFLEAVRLKPDSAVAHKNLGVALARQRRFEEAVSQFEEALRLDPSDAGAQKFLDAARRSQAAGK